MSLLHAITLIAVLMRYAIPRAPGFYHLLLVVPMCIAAVSMFVVGVDLMLADEDHLGGIGVFEVFAVYVTAEVLVLGILNSYAVYFRFKRGRRGR